MKLHFFAALFAALSTTAALAADRPQYGSWGFDSAGMDVKTRPGDDFFRYANGVWLDRTTIPADKPGDRLYVAPKDRVRVW